MRSVGDLLSYTMSAIGSSHEATTEQSKSVGIGNCQAALELKPHTSQSCSTMSPEPMPEHEKDVPIDASLIANDPRSRKWYISHRYTTSS
jgi:hypothetical protein